MQLQDYLHYYYNRHCLEAIKVPGQELRFDTAMVTTRTLFNVQAGLSEVKLVLRRLEDMTDEEKTQIGKLAGWYEGEKIINEHHLEVAHDTMKEMAYDCLITANDNEGDRLGPAAYFSLMPYLLQQRFDLFGLIDAGLAIDIKTI